MIMTHLARQLSRTRKGFHGIDVGQEDANPGFALMGPGRKTYRAASRLQVLFITLDPERDMPDMINAYHADGLETAGEVKDTLLLTLEIEGTDGK